MRKRLFIPLIILFGLLPNLVAAFTFTISEVTVGNEACSGGGSLTFNPTGTTAGGTMKYTIYKLPNTTSIFFNQVGNAPINGLLAGTYRIVAIETVGGVDSAPQTVDATIIKTYVELAINATYANQPCASLSDLTINITAGTPALTNAYSISGPVNVGPQTSNVFTNLPAGLYNIIVRDICGATNPPYSKTIIANPTGITIGAPTFTGTASCNTITVNNLIIANAGTQISYPLTLNYSFTPPPPAVPFTVNNVIVNSGSATSQMVSQTVPYPIVPPFTPYTYTVSVADNCPSSPNPNGGPYNIVNQIGLTATKKLVVCDRFFEINVTNFSPNYHLVVTGPAGFNPATANANYSNLAGYSISPAIFGGVGNSMPLGNYTAMVVDDCGKTLTIPYLFKLENKDTEPSISGINNGCLSTTGTITVTPVSPRKLISATVTAAPTAYSPSPPHIVTANINAAGTLILNPVPLGGPYDLTVTDDCNETYNLTTTIGAYVDKKFAISNGPGCDIGKTSIQGFSLNAGSKITSVTIDSAPAGFPFSTPFNANAYIVGWGAFYMDDLPAGPYKITVTDDCNFTNTKLFNFVSYSETRKNYNFIPHCGSFDVDLDFVTTADPTTETFWLQQKINATDWGRIDVSASGTTSTICPAGTIPNSSNSRPLINNAINANNTINGEFRIVRVFKGFNNGIAINSGAVGLEKNCISEYYGFTFNQALEIKDGYKSSCNAAATQDVIINAVGTPPLTYSYIDGLGNTINNGTNNIFTGIPTGTYTFLVSDTCGHTVPRIFSISTMTNLITIAKPADIVDCSPNITNNEIFNLKDPILTNSILNGLDPTKYTITYFETLPNAQSNTFPIPNPITYNPPTNPAPVYARVIFNALPGCYETTDFQIHVVQTPIINLNNSYQSCFSNTVTLDASTGNPVGTTYLWTDGTTTSTNSIYTVTKAGVSNLTVTATKIYNGVVCVSPTKSIKVTISEKAKLDHIDIVDWTDNDNSIAAFTSNTGAFVYSLDGINYQTSNVFTNLEAGVYTLYIDDTNNCGLFKKNVWLLNFPKFFTPNGDGINDYWHIANSKFEKDFTVYIYDRYGRLLSNFNSNSNGWDGNFNNEQMISDDYWFVIYRQDGRIHKGHFAMKR